MHSRRATLQFVGAGVLSLFGGPALARVPVDAPRRLKLNNLHTGECVKTTYWADGAYQFEALREIDHVLRDFRTGEVISIDRRLLDLLVLLQRRLDTKSDYEVISGYRSPATNAMLAAQGHGVAKHSLHTRGMAIDIRLADRRLDDVRRAARQLRSGGVGYYPKSNFVHVDVGRVRYW